MAEPRIQYAQTEDGVSIAFAVFGQGPPLLWCPDLPNTHLQLEWQNPLHRALYDLLMQGRTLIRFDPRGHGLSDRKIADFSLDTRLLDILAIVDALGLKQFDLFTSSRGGPLAIAYAFRYPERVSSLILWNTFASAREHLETPRRFVDELLDQDWVLFTENVAGFAFGWGDQATQYAEFMRACVTHETAKIIYRALDRDDVGALLSQIRAPTLVIQNDGIRDWTVEMGRSLAARIKNSRLVLIKGTWFENLDDIAVAIDEFLGEGEETATAGAELPEGMAVLLFADIVESTALTEQLGDAAFRGKARDLDASLRAIIRECAGTPVEGKLVGDGVLAVFTSARQAIDCALRCGGASESVGLQLHLGIHAGDVIRERNNVYGGAVNVAARIASASAPGEVLVSDTVRGLARTSAGVSFEDCGEHSLKGIEEPQRLFAVRGGANG
jgi:class 3 adenylate cyclase